MSDWRDVGGCGNSTEFYDMLIKTLPGNARVLEMGVFYGRGLVYLSKHSTFEIYGVDQFKVSEMPHQRGEIDTDTKFYLHCLGNLFKHGAARKVTLIALNSLSASSLFEDHFFDCVFIDGKHDYDSVMEDIATWENKVKRGGFLAGDDYVLPWGGVIEAVDSFFPNRKLMGQTWYTML